MLNQGFRFCRSRWEGDEVRVTDIDVRAMLELSSHYTKLDKRFLLAHPPLLELNVKK